MGTPEEVGRVAGTLVDALKTSPLVLALVVFNILYIAFTTYLITVQGSRAERLIDKALQACPSARPATGSVMFQSPPDPGIFQQ
jgi:hypothetical protein